MNVRHLVPSVSRWLLSMGYLMLAAGLRQTLLVTILDDETEDQWLRNNAAEALGRIGGEGIFERLISMFHDVNLNENVKYGVTKGLGHLGDRRAYEALTEALESSKWPIFLLEALGNLRDRRAVAPLIGYLQHPRHAVVEKSATALGELGDAIAIEPLQRARTRWRDKALDVWVKTAIDKALVKLSTDRLSESRTHDED
jgi:HEAT repeat protein